MPLSQIGASSCRPTGRKRVAVTGHDNSIYTTSLVSAQFVDRTVREGLPRGIVCRSSMVGKEAQAESAAD